MHYFTAKDTARRWGLSPSAVAKMCASGRIVGCVKEERGRWLIPANSLKPVDMRLAEADRLRVPSAVGLSDFKKAVSSYYYVDKTLMIKEILDRRTPVSLFTRPRRFGKTLAMSMLKTWFEKTDADTSRYFRNLAIWECGDRYTQTQGKYPVVMLTLKDAKGSTWDETREMVTRQISEEFARHEELRESGKCRLDERELYGRIVSYDATNVEMVSSLKVLTRMLSKHHGTGVVLILDEYDTPIIQGRQLGFYDEAVAFMRNLLSSGMKDNEFLEFAFITGIMRVSKESLFSGLNNVVVHSVLDEHFSDSFGFTRQEVETMARYYGLPGAMDEISEWYDGYTFGSKEIFNPWSIANYFDEGGVPGAYWTNTSSNELVGELLADAAKGDSGKLQKLLTGGDIDVEIQQDIVYPRIPANSDAVFSFLLMTGYLSIVNRSRIVGASREACSLRVPNKEVAGVFQSEILGRVVRQRESRMKIADALAAMDIDTLQRGLNRFLQEAPSYLDTPAESFFHGLVLGLCALLGNEYQVSSNRESGYGRYDIQLAPRDAAGGLPGILIEVKRLDDAGDRGLMAKAEEAVEQIRQRAYVSELHVRGVESVLAYGMAFSGKRAAVAAGEL